MVLRLCCSVSSFVHTGSVSSSNPVISFPQLRLTDTGEVKVVHVGHEAVHFYFYCCLLKTKLEGEEEVKPCKRENAHNSKRDNGE